MKIYHYYLDTLLIKAVMTVFFSEVLVFDYLKIVRNITLQVVKNRVNVVKYAHILICFLNSEKFCNSPESKFSRKIKILAV